MGFIENAASDIADTDKMVISVWFKIPQEAITAAIAQYIAADGGNDDSNMHGIIPLVSFGVPSAVTGGPTPFTSRCFIGVSCGHYEFSYYADEDPLPDPHLFVYLQYDTGTNESPLGVSTFDFFQVGGNISYLFAPGNLLLEGDIVITPLTVTADEWHHALVSFDLSNGCSMTNSDSGSAKFNGDACELWWALDDVNYSGDSLWPSHWTGYTGADSGGTNDIVSAGVLTGLASAAPDELVSFAAGNLPVAGNPMGIPASTADAIDHVYNIYMSELQIFTGVSLDTSVLANRRAFITAAGRPAAPSLAATLLGKSPEIHFQTHTDFIEGNNRGTADNFDPTGTIIGYTPGP